METKAKVICSVVGFLGLLSAVLGFVAEATRIKASQIQITFSPNTTCTYPGSPASVLGLIAAVALTVAQIIISVTTGCVCCRRRSYQADSNSGLAIIFYFISWITFVIAFLMLLAGALIYEHGGSGSSNSGTYSCYVVKPGVFGWAAVLSFATAVLGIICYLALDSAKTSNNSWTGTAAAPNQGGIAMGDPQHPPPQHPPPPYRPTQSPAPNAEAPVFVHENTYMRRQFT